METSKPVTRPSNLVAMHRRVNIMMYRLYVTIEGHERLWGEYSQLNHVQSAIRMLVEDFEFVEVSEPSEYRIVIEK
jgi:hypothetical protein